MCVRAGVCVCVCVAIRIRRSEVESQGFKVPSVHASD